MAKNDCSRTKGDEFSTAFCITIDLALLGTRLGQEGEQRLIIEPCLFLETLKGIISPKAFIM